MDKNMQNIQEEVNPKMRQLLVEAMLRGSNRVPDTETEWNKLKLMQTAKRRRLLRTSIYYICACAAAVAVVVFLLPIWQQPTGDVVVYEATPQARKVTIVAEAAPANSVLGKVASSTAVKPSVLTLDVPAGMTHHLSLPDGTQVWLNAESRITYPKAFTGATREVHVEGEAYFKVTKNARKPFLVHVSGLTVRVKGTEFNVNSYQPESVAVTLASGHVVVSSDEPSQANESCEITEAGATATLSDDGLQVGMLDLDYVTGWREGIIAFDEASLRDVLLHIGSWYNMTVVCHETCNLNVRLHCVYDRNKTVEETLEMLKNIIKINFEIKNHTIFVD